MFFRVVWLALLIACGTATFSTVEDEEDAVSKEDVEVVPSADVVATSLVEYTTKQRLAWHFPCESDDAWTWGERDFTGQGVYSKNMRYVESLSLTVSGVLCDIRYLPRDVVFVIDTSSSMSSNDPTAADGSCVRSRAMDRMAAYLSRFDNARVGLVTYNSYVRAMSDHLVPAADFYADYLAQRERMQNLLCFSNYYTNYRRALLKTEKLLQTGRTNSFREIYFFSDGEPLESIFVLENPAGLYIAERLRQHATIATVGLGKTGILKDKIASRINDVPLHRQAENLDELFVLLRELVQTKNVGAELTYRYLGAEDAYTIDILRETGVQADEFFQLEPLLFSIDADDPQKNKGIAIDINYWDNNGNTYNASGELHFTFE